MIEALVIGLVTAAGVAVLAPFRTSLVAFGAVFLAPIVGTAVYVMCAVLLVAFDSFSTVRALVLMCVAAATVAVHWWRSERPVWVDMRALLRQIAISVGGVSVLSAVIHLVPLTRVSFDSFWYLMAASALEQHGGMSSVPFGFNEVLKRQLVIPVMHAGGVIAGRGYFVSWIPIVAVSALSSTAWIAWHGGAFLGTAKRWRILIIVTTVAFVVTTNQFMFHVFYVNGHMVFAAFLLVGVGLSWYAATCGEWRLLIPASVAFAALVPLRAEAVIVIVMFVLPIITTQEKPTWTRWVLAGPITAVTILWYGWAIQGAFPSLSMEGRATVFGNLFLAVALLVLAGIADKDRLWPVVRVVPVLPLVAMMGATVIQMSVGFDAVWTTFSNLAVNMATEGLWSTLWWVAPLLVFGAYIAISFPFQRYFLLPLVTFAVALPVFAYLRGSPYRVGFGDSGNRMLMHVVLVLALYLMLAAITAAVTEPPPQKSETR